MQKVIEQYESKMMEIENARASDKIVSVKIQYELQKKIQELEADLKAFGKSEQSLYENIINLKSVIEDQKKKIDTLNEQK